YTFSVEVVATAKESAAKLKIVSYDVVVFDVRLEEEDSGLYTAFALHQEAGATTPIRLMFTGFPSYRDCVRAMRCGAWDYIVKEDVGDVSMFDVLVNSALDRLRQLDLREKQENAIAIEWLPKHIYSLHAGYRGKLVALWQNPADAKI